MGAQKHTSFDILDASVRETEQKLIQWRRQIHENPELGYCEEETSNLVAGVLESLGFEVHRGFAKTGVIGLLRGQNERPLVGLRADMDALPLKEQTGLPFASTKFAINSNGDKVPVGHMCGHDAHVAILLATAEALSKCRDQLKGSVMLIFQPCEEGDAEAEAKGLSSSGAVQMVFAERLFEKFPKPDAFFALHVAGLEHGGKIAIKSGPLMASSDSWTARIIGQQTHGSQPWTGRDAITCAAQTVNNLQTIVSREADLQLLGPAVVTVGTINGGLRLNVIAGECTMTGTTRAITMETREMLRERVKDIILASAAMSKCHAEFKPLGGIPPVINDPACAEFATDVIRDIIQLPLAEPLPPVMASDDVSAFHTVAPSVYMFLACAPLSGPVINHMPNYDVDETVLIQGARALAHLTANFMEFPIKSTTHKPSYEEEIANYTN